MCVVVRSVVTVVLEVDAVDELLGILIEDGTLIGLHLGIVKLLEVDPSVVKPLGVDLVVDLETFIHCQWYQTPCLLTLRRCRTQVFFTVGLIRMLRSEQRNAQVEWL